MMTFYYVLFTADLYDQIGLQINHKDKTLEIYL